VTNPNAIDPDLMQFALDQATTQDSDIEYADVKWMRRSSRSIGVKNGSVEQNTQQNTEGIGIKILYGGAYGFAATNIMTKDAIGIAAKRALRVAKASATTMRNPIQLAEEPVHVDTVATPMKIDPDDVDLAETIAVLVDASKAADIGDDRIKARSASYDHWKDHMVLWTSEGSRIDQLISVVGGAVDTLSVQGTETQRRSYPASFRGDFSTAGYEYFKDMELVENAPIAAQESVDLLEAEQCPEQNDATVIIRPAQLMLQLHENFHGAELDRALDYEAAFAGTSFLKPHLLGELQFGSELININTDATHPGGLGTFFYDHEGVKAQNQPMVKNGKFVGYMTSRETAPLMGLERSNGTARSSAYDRMPLIRMTNTILQPGDYDYQEMIEETKDGFIFDTNVSWSIDDLRLSFQFGTEIGWRIKDGEITNLVKNPSYTGITPQFWNSADAVADKNDFRMYGTPNCGKGEPGQVMYTGHGSSSVRFRDVRIGVVQL